MADEQEKKEQRKGLLLKFINPVSGKTRVEGNFSQIPNNILFDKKKKVTSFDKVVYCIFFAMPHRKGVTTSDTIHTNYDWLSEVIGVSTRTLQYSLDRLEKAGYCRRKKINGQLSEVEVIISPSETDKQNKLLEEMKEEQRQISDQINSDVSA